MSLETWLAFAVTSAALLAVPGPTVLLVVSYALGHGRSSGWATVPGVILGDFTAMTVSLLGAGAVLATSATLFTLLKLCGAVYLVWLGVRLWLARPDLSNEPMSEPPAMRTRAMFWNSYFVTALNPKGLVFFVAFVPQFVNTSAPALPQFAVLEATFLGLALINVAAWSILAGRLRQAFRRPGAMRLANRAGGGFLIAAGVLTAAVRQ